MIADIRVGKIEWQPIALSAKHRVRVDNDLIYSNELIISIAFNTNQHINGGHDDRNLTIEHESLRQYPDYKMEHGACAKSWMRQMNIVQLQSAIKSCFPLHHWSGSSI